MMVKVWGNHPQIYDMALNTSGQALQLGSSDRKMVAEHFSVVNSYNPFPLILNIPQILKTMVPLVIGGRD